MIQDYRSVIKMTNTSNNEFSSFAVVIFAHNESLLIEKTVNAVIKTLRPSDSLFVVADNCSDATAELATKAGAKVYIRENQLPLGKGAAIDWFIQNHYDHVMNYDYVVILDADSLLDPDFIEGLDKSLTGEIDAAQCILTPVEYSDSPLSTLIALSEIIEHGIFEQIRSWLGLSVRLRGTGMVLKPWVLHEVSRRVDTEVEDIALSLLLAERHIRVWSIHNVTVFDPKPREIAAASRQRARWFRGQWYAFWKYRNTIIKLLLSGPNGWSVLSSIFLKPRWLKLIVLLILAAIFIHIPVMTAIILAYISFEASMIAFGVLRHNENKKFLRALLYMPGFVWMWIKSIFLSLHRQSWLRAR